MIYINGRFLTQRMTGINRFAFELCKAMARLDISFQVITPHEILDSYDISDFKIIKYGRGSSHIWEQIILPTFFIRKHKYLLINFTGLGPIIIKKKVMTIHDIGFLNTQWYSKSYHYFYSLFTPISAKRSIMILTVSEFSKNELIEKLKISSSKIEVIYNAVSENFIKNKINKSLNFKKEDYILAVSSLNPRKNFNRLIEAFQIANVHQLKLYIIGECNKVFLNTEIKDDYENIKYLGYVSEEELHLYYKNAIAFIFPSLYEGFGIPPLEAMALGCPTIVSNIPALKEVCGEAAIYIDPYDTIGIARTIENLIHNRNSLEKLKILGYDRVCKYSWDDSAVKLKDLLINLTQFKTEINQ